MRVISLSFFIICFLFADNPTIDSNHQSLNNEMIDNISSSLDSKVQSGKLSDDERLKDEIITFDRVDYIKENSRIDDPFIYVFPQSDEDLEHILKTEQAILVLNGIFENKASINNTWVGKDDIVEGWTVSDIQRDRVELKFRTQKKVLYVYTNDNKIKIK